MLRYDKLKDKPRAFLAATGGTLAEFERLLPAFQAAYQNTSPPDLTYAGKARQRRAGGGAKGTLPSFDDKLVCILVSQKTNPLHVMHGLQCELSQAQAHYWMHRLLPVLQRAWRDLGQAPERDAHRVEASALALAGAPPWRWMAPNAAANARETPPNKRNTTAASKRRIPTRISSWSTNRRAKSSL